MSKKNNPRLPLNDSFTDFLLYTTPNGKVKVEFFLLKKIFESGELQEEQVSSILEHTTQHGAIGNFTVNHTHPIANALRSQLNQPNAVRNNDIHEMCLIMSAVRTQLNRTTLTSQDIQFLTSGQRVLGEI